MKNYHMSVLNFKENANKIRFFFSLFLIDITCFIFPKIKINNSLEKIFNNLYLKIVHWIIVENNAYVTYNLERYVKFGKLRGELFGQNHNRCSEISSTRERIKIGFIVSLQVSSKHKSCLF